MILKKDIDIPYVDKSRDLNFTWFWAACANGDLERAEWLLSLGANIESRNVHGLTPLHIAAELGDEELINLMIEADLIDRMCFVMGYRCGKKRAIRKRPELVTFIRLGNKKQIEYILNSDNYNGMFIDRNYLVFCR